MIGALETRVGARIAYCNSCRVTPDGRHAAPWLSSDVARLPFDVFARRCVVAIHSFVIERALVVELGGFDPSLHRSEDWDLWQRIARTGVPFLPVPAAFAFYRSRRQSLSRDVRAMLADSRTVIERGFGPDPRVLHPDPRHAAGADPGMGGTKEMAIAHAALWTAAFDVGEGGDGKGLIVPLPDRGGDLLEACRQNILDGLTCGAGTLMEGPYSDQPAFLAAVRVLLAETERAAGRPGLARLLEFALEPEIFRPPHLTERLVAGRALFVRLEVDRLQPVDPPPGVDTLHVEFRKDGRYLARAEAPMLGALSSRELSAIAIEAMSPSVYLKESGVLSRPRFWLQAVIELARLPLSPTKSLAPRTLARKVLAGAAIATSGPSIRSNHHALVELIAEGCAQAMTVSLQAPVPRAGAIRVEAQAHETTERLPILMYHRIATDGPADLARYRTTPEAFTQQMRWLRKHGYHAVTSTDIARHLADARPFRGRPVLLAFDDGYRDFHGTAWPILRAHDFTAEVMVVTDRVGGTADWDADYGPPAPLMGWPEIQALAAAGVRFGSHMASHSHMAELSSREIVLEVARSRALIERALGEPCLSIAAPFGEASERFVRLAQGCGYQVGFTIDPGIAWLSSDPLRLPRLEVRGDWSIEAFASALRPAII